LAASSELSKALIFWRTSFGNDLFAISSTFGFRSAHAAQVGLKKYNKTADPSFFSSSRDFIFNKD